MQDPTLRKRTSIRRDVPAFRSLGGAVSPHRLLHPQIFPLPTQNSEEPEIFCGIFGWGTVRIIRSEVLSVQEEDYILAARAIGTFTGRIILRHAHCVVDGSLSRTVHHHHCLRVQYLGR